MGGVYRTPKVETLDHAQDAGVGVNAPLGPTGLLKTSWGLVSVDDMMSRLTRLTSEGNRKPCE